MVVALFLQLFEISSHITFTSFLWLFAEFKRLNMSAEEIIAQQCHDGNAMAVSRHPSHTNVFQFRNSGKALAGLRSLQAAEFL
jgi:hypothetical protein